MNWLFETLHLNPPELSEPKLNCESCTIDSTLNRSDEYQPETKCCLFKPYWSSLAVGYYSTQKDISKVIEPIKDRLMFLPVGIVHTLEERKAYSAFQKGEIKAVEPCGFFNKEKRHCNIWQARPATCSSFFCTSQYKEGSEFYSQYESFTMGLESDLVREWFLGSGYSDEDWVSFIEYFDEDTNKELPPHLVIKDFQEALKLYKSCYNWVEKNGAPMIPSYYLLMDQHRRLC